MEHVHQQVVPHDGTHGGFVALAVCLAPAGQLAARPPLGAVADGTDQHQAAHLSALYRQESGHQTAEGQGVAGRRGAGMRRYMVRRVLKKARGTRALQGVARTASQAGLLKAARLLGRSRRGSAGRRLR